MEPSTTKYTILATKPSNHPEYALKKEPNNLIGSGTYGCVYKGFSLDGSYQRVAVKVMPLKNKLHSLQKEKTAFEKLVQLKSDNIVNYYRAFESENNLYLVMELCEEGNLYDKIAARSVYFSVGEAIDLL